MSINKADLIKKVKETNISLTNEDATLAVDTALKAIQTELRDGGEVKLHGFGTFSTKERPARMGRNPATGASIQISASTNVKFKPVSGFLA